jgi:hypothetical protein
VRSLAKLIVRDAHAQKRKVDANLEMESDEFALGQSGSFLDVHRRGVIHFRGKARLKLTSRSLIKTAHSISTFFSV